MSFILSETIEVKVDFGSNQTELNRTNSILSRRTALELFDYFCARNLVRSHRTDQLNSSSSPESIIFSSF